MRRLPVLLPLLVLVPAPVLAAPPPTQKEVEAVIEDSRKAWQVPGVAVVVVADDKVVYLAGHGVREQGKSGAVTPDTLFGIGSCTKAFAATALAALVDDGKLKWDDHPRKYLPWFRLKDPLADRDVTIRDLLCHRTGLGRHDELWSRAPWSLEESVRRLAHLEPNTSFRSTFEYANIPYIAAGLVITEASGMPWNDFVRKRLFNPLGMKGPVFTRTDMVQSKDRGVPHRLTSNKQVEAIDWYDDDKQVRASGSIKASVRDLAPWVRFNLGDGTFEGKRILNRPAFQEVRKPHVVVGIPTGFAKDQERTHASYALGWHVTDYRGQLLHEHGGSVVGFRARTVLVPKARLGLVVLCNMGGSDLPEALSRRLLDLYLGLERRDWDAWYMKRAEREKELAAESRKAFLASRVPDTKPSRPLDAYVGTYRNASHGDATLTLDGGSLSLGWSSHKVRLSHFHYDTFRYTPGDSMPGRTVVFHLDSDGTPTRLEFQGQKFVRVKGKE